MDTSSETAYQVAERYAANEITREQMLETLINWDYAPQDPSSGNSTPVAGHSNSFAETVGRAFKEGLISGSEYDVILKAFVDNHTTKNLIERQLAAERLRARGVHVDLGVVNTSLNAEGYEVECVDCGRVAKLPFDPGDKVGLCPSCVRLRSS